MGKQSDEIFIRFQPVVTKRASEEIYDQIRELILSGELTPEDRLPSERKMMDMFKRSRPTIREALRMLERSGYIRTVAGSNGAIVMAPNDKIMKQTMEDALQVGLISLAEMSEFRKISEVAAVTWAAQRANQEDVNAMREHLLQMEALINDHEKFVELDPKFHGLIARAAKNNVSVAFNETFGKISRSFMAKRMASMVLSDRQTMCQRVHDMHKAIFSAIQMRDSNEARKAMEYHISAFEADLQ